MAQVKGSDYLNIAVTAAKQAGQYLRRKMPASQVVDAALAHDLKLAADRDSEKRIIAFLRKRTPFSILSEESGLLTGADQRHCWVVDPLDGTINYFHRLALCCVSIALCRNGQPIVGVIYDFNSGELFTGVAGKGAWLNGGRIRVSPVKQKAKAVMATGFPGKDKISAQEIALFGQNVRAYHKLRLLGTAALSMAYVANGRLDAYFEKDIKFWDVAAGTAIVEAAGGKVVSKSAAGAHTFDVFASNGNLEK